MYSEHYGLTGNPFQLTPDPRFYFESETHRKAMAYLGYGLAQGEGFIVITGDIGAGKTTLVGHLMATIDQTCLTAVQLVSTQVEGDDMLRLVAQQLGIDSQGAEKAQLLDQIERFLHGQAREGKRTLLIVDEAQNLETSALEELRMLSNFQSGGRALLQIFLLGQPEFRERVKISPHLEQLRQRIIATHHLEAMQANEVESYVVHRLSVAGWQGTPQFTTDAYAALYNATAGVPRKLNTFMARVLLFGAVEDLQTIDASAVGSVMNDLAGESYDSEPDMQSQPTMAAEEEMVAPVVEEPITYESPSDDDHFVSPAEELVVEEAMVETEASHAEPNPVMYESTPEPMMAAKADDHRDERIEALENRLEEQEAALRRVLTLLVNWVEEEESRPNLGVVQGSAA